MTVGDGDDGVVERCVNVGNALSDVLLDLLANFGSSLCHVLSLLLLASDGLARALAGAGIGTGALTAAGQALAVTQTTVATKVHQALDIHRDFATQVTFNGELAHFVTQTIHVRIGQVLHFGGAINTPAASQIFCARVRPMP
jgi:hypothetical protein